MKFQELESLGLTKSEVLVYTTLLKIGQSSTGKVVKEAKISSGKIYEILDKLIEKGLVSFVVKNGVKNFSASSPEKIKEYLDKKKKEFEEKSEIINKLIPELEEINKGKKPDYLVEVYEGFEGFKSAFRFLVNSLEKGEEYLGAGIGLTERSKTIELFYLQLEKEFRNKKIKEKFILMEKSERLNKYLKNFKCEFRYLLGFHLAPFGIAGDIVMLHNFKELSVILIRNKTIAEQFRFLFDSLWKLAKK